MATVTKRKQESATGIWRMSFRITGNTGLCWGKRSPEVRRDDEAHDAFDERTALTRVRLDENNNVAISSQGLKKAILVGATRLNIKVPGGGGKATFKARLTAALLVTQEAFAVYKNGKLVTLDDLSIEAIDVPANPDKPKGPRVTRRFPKLYGTWEAACSYLLTDEMITEDLMLKHIRAAGIFDGIGTFRVGTGQSHGLFSIAERPDGTPDLEIVPFTM